MGFLFSVFVGIALAGPAPTCKAVGDLDPLVQARHRVEQRIASGAPPVAVTNLEPDGLGRFYEGRDGILVIGDHHGTEKICMLVAKAIDNPSVDWLTMEMIPSNYQDRVDAFMAGSAAAKSDLIAMFDRGWAHGDSPKKGEENIYYQLLVAAKAKGKRVYAADVHEDDSVPVAGVFGVLATVPPRNVLWASHLPAKGNGVVYGGAGHFELNWNLNFQDFAAERGRSSLYYLAPQR